jgi:hypothetical protein
VLYQKSESADKLKYSILIDLIDGKVVLGSLSGAASSDGGSLKK